MQSSFTFNGFCPYVVTSSKEKYAVKERLHGDPGKNMRVTWSITNSSVASTRQRTRCSQSSDFGYVADVPFLFNLFL